MVTKIDIKCDVKGCKEEGCHKVDCCQGWIINKDDNHYKKFEMPLKERKTDLCENHWKKWSKLTCKFLKMDRELI